MINLDNLAKVLIPADPMKDEYTQGITAGVAITIECVKDLIVRNIEPLTDREKRIFLAAMGREEKICKELDEKYSTREPYEDTLVHTCKQITRKVKSALWAEPGSKI